MLVLKNILLGPLYYFKSEWEYANGWGRLGMSTAAIIFILLLFLFLAAKFEPRPSFEYLASLNEETSFEEWDSIFNSTHLAKWDEASLALILNNMQQKAQTYEQWDVFRKATVNRPEYAHITKQALKKMLTLAQSYEQAKFIYKNDDYNRDIKNDALTKMADFARTFEEWEYVMKKTYPASPLHARALAAMQKLANH